MLSVAKNLMCMQILHFVQDDNLIETLRGNASIKRKLNEEISH